MPLHCCCIMRQLVAVEPDHRRNHRKSHGKPDIGRDNRLAFRSAISIEFSARKLCCGHACQPAQDQRGADLGKNRGAKAVERLRESEAAVHRCLRAEQADQRIGNHLHQDNAAGEDEQGTEEEFVSGRMASWDEQQAPGHHRQQADGRAAHVSDPLDKLRTGDANRQIGGEEAKLHQHRFGIAERKQLLQLGQDHVIERGDPAEDKEQCKHEILQARSVDGCAFRFDWIGIAAGCNVGCQGHRLVLSFLVSCLSIAANPSLVDTALSKTVVSVIPGS